MGLGDTYWPLILPFLTGGGFFNIFLIRQFLMTIPKELDEAASIDGAGRMRILWTILVPSIKPAVVVVGMMLFIQIWNDLLQQIIYINSMSKFTFAIALTNFGSHVYDNPSWYCDLYLRAEELCGRNCADWYEKLNYNNINIFRQGGGPACTKFKMRM